MAVDRGAQVVHHALPDLVGEQGLDDAERARDDGDPDHPRDEQVEQAQVVLGQRGVEDGLDQEGRYGAEHRGEDDQAEDAAEPEPGTAGRGRRCALRYARRTAGSDGRSGGSSYSNARPRPRGTRRRVPERGAA